MADFADNAQAEQEVLESANLKEQQRRAQAQITALQKLTGYCLNCNVPLHNSRFCDEDCRDDFEVRARSRSMAAR